MHSTATFDEFLRLRLQGLSFARIARRLGVSKPTLIQWNRKAKPDLNSRSRQHLDAVLKSIDDSHAQLLADLERRHLALRQVLLTRALRDVPTPEIEALAGEYHQQIQNLKNPNAGLQSPNADSESRNADLESAVSQTCSLPTVQQPPSTRAQDRFLRLGC
jgi:transcriptional regulator with XRE-family HTH domain